MKRVLLLFLFVGVLPVPAQNKTLINLDKNGIAIQGYDPVAFFTQGRPVKGQAEFRAALNESVQQKRPFNRVTHAIRLADVRT